METVGKRKFPLEKASSVAKEIFDLLKPHCERVKICGSIRRRRPFCSDVEVLFIPKMREVTIDLFNKGMVSDSHIFLESLLASGIIAKRTNINGSTMWGESNMFGTHAASGIPVDFFSTTAENWFVALVIRTGGKVTNLRLTTGAIKRGMTLHAYGNGFERIRDGTKIPCNSEQDVFKFAGVPYLEPRERP